MEHYIGIDVSLELSSLCVLDVTGKIIREAKVASEPEALVAFLRSLELMIARVGLECENALNVDPMQKSRMALILL